MQVIALYNIKGGVGKTTAAVNLSYLSAKEGIMTLLIDFDPQSSSTYFFRVKPKIKTRLRRALKKPSLFKNSIKGTDFNFLDILPGNIALRKMDILLNNEKKSQKKLIKIIKSLMVDYSLIIIDSPAYIGLLAENIFHAADIILIPIIPTPLSLRSYETIKKFFLKNKLEPSKLRPFFSMVESRKKVHSNFLNTGYNCIEGLFNTYIPYSAIVEKMGVRKEPLPAFAPSAKPTRHFNMLWEEVLANLNKLSR